MTENKRFTVKQRESATNYSIIDYYGELPLSEGIYYKSNAKKLCNWLNRQHDINMELYKENEQLKQLVDEAEDIIVCQCTPYYQRIWENIKKNIKGDTDD